MKKWLKNISYKMQQWMQGRYGNDELNTAAYLLCLVFLILSYSSSFHFLLLPAFVLMIWSCFRCFSRNLYKRNIERRKYLQVTGNIRSWFRLQRDRWRDRKSYRYFRCRQCKAPLRVPRGKGKIKIRCPKCGSEQDAKT